MKRTTSIIIAIAALLLGSNATAGNTNANPCGNNGNNCQPSAPTYNQPEANAGALALAGAAAGAIATGGDANAVANGGTAFGGGGGSANIGDIRNTANGGAGGSVFGSGNSSATGGSVLGSGNSANHNTNTAFGGKGGEGGSAVSIAEGGKGGTAFGGNAHQSQGQQQGQSQSNVGVNSQGQSSSTSTDQRQTATATNAGNSQQVGGQSTNIKFEDVANAPPVFLGNISATMSCSGGFNAGGSSQDGSGALGFSWVSGDCRSVVAADKFRELGMVDTACKILKTTKGFKRAVKSDPSLADVSCSIAK